MEFFIEFRPKDNKKFQRANVTAIRRMLQINPPLEWKKLPREIVLSSSLAALKNAIFSISDFLLFGVFVTVIAIVFYYTFVIILERSEMFGIRRQTVNQSINQSSGE